MTDNGKDIRQKTLIQKKNLKQDKDKKTLKKTTYLKAKSSRKLLKRNIRDELTLDILCLNKIFDS